MPLLRRTPTISSNLCGLNKTDDCMLTSKNLINQVLEDMKKVLLYKCKNDPDSKMDSTKIDNAIDAALNDLQQGKPHYTALCAAKKIMKTK